MARRLPSQPPVLPGFSYVHVLGSGGFADVFLYEQNMPRRQVAVKVMLSEVVNDQVRQMFQAEANLMAQLSAHPSILTVYQASVSSDGRPYLVMELCSAALSERYRREPLPVAEVLRIAVKIGSAIETAHRAGVLHRDIKPSNILLTAYGHPVLSDFGIASTLTAQREQDSVGLSIPWSAPEVLLDETPGTIASEVWSLGATVYSLLAGRSPFEIPGGSNSSSDLMARIGKARPQSIGRPDVPASLEALLRRSMARRADQRPGSALEFVRELQLVEAELGIPQTSAEIVMEEWALGTVADDEDRTRLRPVATGSAPPRSGGRRRRTPARAQAAYAPVGTVREPSAPASGPFSKSRPAEAGPRARGVAWVLAAAALLVTGLGATALVVLLRTLGSDVPVVSDIDARLDSGGRIEFSWRDPGLSEGDRYQVQVVDEGVAATPTLQESAVFVVDADPGDTVCVTVAVNREGATGASSSEKCVEAAEG
ncbi:serine/threonine-protein kinase [Homoserinibacter sp. GY 40078]|uniref:serine/threonine-protein kinase n=1 Tax=Homoserinibacter sp. GY 40078 TaxID=2603275 RepID=UPI0011CC74F2|nr:serine/threonine-protein kinase [Homoserinibacter sp. GY 40078]TXK17287.1 serine/threonine protein kinase [Homoserinibacter sp. GY 40078]